jgi:DNA-binding NarL/FixJ family response regulator
MNAIAAHQGADPRHPVDPPNPANLVDTANQADPTGTSESDGRRAVEWPGTPLRAVVIGDSFDRLAVVREALTAARVECEIHCPGLSAPIAGSTSSTVCLVVENDRTELLSQVHGARRMTSRLPILVIWNRPEETDFLALIAAGALGCISVDRITIPTRLHDLLQAAADGQAIVPRGLVRLLVNEVWQRSTSEHLAVLGLTRREEEILILLLDGMTTKEMAARFYVSAVTIRTHLSAIYRKVGVGDRRSAVELVNRLPHTARQF